MRCMAMPLGPLDGFALGSGDVQNAVSRFLDRVVRDRVARGPDLRARFDEYSCYRAFSTAFR